MSRSSTLAACCVALALLAGCGGSSKGSGGRIAFVSTSASAVELYLMNADGTGRQRLTHGDAVGFISDFLSDVFPPGSPSWSPDGKWIVYENDDPGSGSRHIDIVAADGTGKRVLVGDAFSPEWSPNDDLIAFTRERQSGADVWVIRPDGTGRRLLVRDAVYSAWSPDGTRIAYTRLNGKGSDLYTSRKDGSDERRLTAAAGTEFSPTWSSTGKIAFVRDAPTGWDIFVVDEDGTNDRPLTRNKAHESTPTWSPDGSKLAFASDLDFTKEQRKGEEIFVLASDGSRRTRLTRNTVRDLAPAWEPSP